MIAKIALTLSVISLALMGYLYLDMRSTYCDLAQSVRVERALHQSAYEDSRSAAPNPVLSQAKYFAHCN